MSKWSTVISGVLQESLLGQALFNFVSDMDSGIECTCGGCALLHLSLAQAYEPQKVLMWLSLELNC